MKHGDALAVKAKTITDFCISLVFPKICIGCEKEGFCLCPKCFKKIKIQKTPLCIYCGKIANKGLCQTCSSKTPLTGVLVGCKYSGLVKEIIHRYKYDGDKELANPLCEILLEKLNEKKFNSETLITSVPLHKKRQNYRGFNQSEIIARKIARSAGINYEKLLGRKVFNQPQMTLSRRARKENLLGAFSSLGADLHGKTIIVVDDVCTTGATLEECAKTLRKSGARQVWGLVIAHGS